MRCSAKGRRRKAVCRGEGKGKKWGHGSKPK